MSIEHQYEMEVKWEEGRVGMMQAAGLDDTIKVATPPEFNGGVPGVWSPEHLLVAAVNSCLMTTFLAIAENFKVNYDSFISKASGKLEMVEGKYMISEITLRPVVEMQDACQKEKMERVLQKAEAACLISNSVRSKIIYDPEVRLVMPQAA